METIWVCPDPLGMFPFWGFGKRISSPSGNPELVGQLWPRCRGPSCARALGGGLQRKRGGGRIQLPLPGGNGSWDAREREREREREPQDPSSKNKRPTGVAIGLIYEPRRAATVDWPRGETSRAEPATEAEGSGGPSLTLGILSALWRGQYGRAWMPSDRGYLFIYLAGWECAACCSEPRRASEAYQRDLFSALGSRAEFLIKRGKRRCSG
ncbi:hypothetical protein LZ30DRAFT_257228 [Colletotrichum cereale]|nr:hypothetical protein LZ30DRAFT_257228 [Colletotrichum cereale]